MLKESKEIVICKELKHFLGNAWIQKLEIIYINAIVHNICLILMYSTIVWSTQL